MKRSFSQIEQAATPSSAVVPAFPHWQDMLNELKVETGKHLTWSDLYCLALASKKEFARFSRILGAAIRASYQEHNILGFMLRSCSLEQLRWIEEEFDPEVIHYGTFFEASLVNFDFRVYEYLFPFVHGPKRQDNSHLLFVTEDNLLVALKHRNFSVATHLLNRGVLLNFNTPTLCEYSLDALKLVTEYYPIQEPAWVLMVVLGNYDAKTECLEYLAQQVCNRFPHELSANPRRRTELLRTALMHGVEYPIDMARIYTHAIQYLEVEKLKWVNENLYPIENFGIAIAQLELPIYYRPFGCYGSTIQPKMVNLSSKYRMVANKLSPKQHEERVMELFTFLGERGIVLTTTPVTKMIMGLGYEHDYLRDTSLGFLERLRKASIPRQWDVIKATPIDVPDYLNPHEEAHGFQARLKSLGLSNIIISTDLTPPSRVTQVSEDE